MVVPPTNHLAKGDFHSRTFWNGVFQKISSLPRAPQYPSGSRSACAASSRYWSIDLMWAWRENSGGGWKTRPSVRTEVISGEVGSAMATLLSSVQGQTLAVLLSSAWYSNQA